MGKEKREIPPDSFDYIRESQEAWRRLRRGLMSRPRELPIISRALDTSMKKVFAGYISPDRPAPVIVWSILLDESKEDTFTSDIRRPLDVMKNDAHAYLLGIHQLNEWATDYATRYWFAHISRSRILQQFEALYADIGITPMRLNYARAYGYMEQTNAMAQRRGENFDHAVFTALFHHDFRLLNHCIAEAHIPGCRTITDVALLVGRKLPKRNLTATMLSLQEASEVSWKNGVKRTLVSILTAGVHERPGVVYIHLAPSIFESFSLGLATGGATGDIFSGIGMGLIAGGLVNVLLVYVGVHEAVHEYSMDRKFVGFIPLDMKY